MSHLAADAACGRRQWKWGGEQKILAAVSCLFAVPSHSIPFLSQSPRNMPPFKPKLYLKGRQIRSRSHPAFARALKLRPISKAERQSRHFGMDPDGKGNFLGSHQAQVVGRHEDVGARMFGVAPVQEFAWPVPGSPVANRFFPATAAVFLGQASGKKTKATW